MKKYIVIFATLCGCLIVFQLTAFACNCDLPPAHPSLEQQVKKAKRNSAAVFAGEVLDVQKSSEFSRFFTIRLNYKWKGVFDSEVITVVTGVGNGDCGYPFRVGETYLVYAYKSSTDALSTNVCQRTNLFAESKNEAEFLGKAKKFEKSAKS